LEELDQGCVLYGIRSAKYPDLCCYAIIISASCDIANCKLSKLYYVVGVDAQEWLQTERGFEFVFKDHYESKQSNLNELSQKNGINLSKLCEFSDDQINLILHSNVPIKKERDKYISYIQELRKKETAVGRGAIIRANTKYVVSVFKNITKGAMTHYYYLPRTAFSSGSDKGNGLIVDLQEIGSISLEEAQQIVTPGIDYKCLPKDPDEKQMMLSRYWLNREDDFVAIDGKIASPNREHLMQRFSNSFVRIGLDGATENDFIRLIESL